jgi:hypothetical protein
VPIILDPFDELASGAIEHYWQTLDEQKAKQSPDDADHRALQVSSSKK